MLKFLFLHGYLNNSAFFIKILVSKFFIYLNSCKINKATILSHCEVHYLS